MIRNPTRKAGGRALKYLVTNNEKETSTTRHRYSNRIQGLHEDPSHSEARTMKNRPNIRTIITLTGPTCSGKSTLESKLSESYGLSRLISSTTRDKRPKEVHGYDYYFLDKSEFKRLVVQGQFAEHDSFNGNYYGVSRQEIERHPVDKPVVVVVEPKGAKSYREFCNRQGWRHLACYVDVDPVVQATRFYARLKGDEPEKQLIHRLAVMIGEESTWKQDLGLYDYVINGFSEETEQTVLAELSQILK